MVSTIAVRADALSEGDTVLAKGKTWAVTAIKVRRKKGTAALTLTGDGGSFSADVPADRRFDRVELTGPAGEQQRWATPAEAAEPVSSEAAAATVSAVLGARLIGAQRDAEGRYVVPRVDEATVYAHLLTFHGIGVEPATLDAARELGEAEHTAAEALALADFGQAVATHAADHRERPTEQLHVPHLHVAA